MRWEDPVKYHITLKFLGNTDESSVEKLKTVLQKTLTDLHPFETGFEELSAFPDFRNPGVIVVKLSTSEFFDRLQAKVNKACRDFAKPDKRIRDFVPHITVGRVKKNFKLSGNLKEIGKIQFEISKIGVVCSTLSSHGSKYRTLNVVDL